MNRFSYFTSRLPSLRAALATAMAIFTLAAGPISQTLAVARVESADARKQNDSARFTLVVVSAWDEAAAKSAEPASSNKNENKPVKHPSLLRPLSDQWDTAKVVQFSADVPVEIAPVQPGSVALIEIPVAPQPVFVPPHNPIRPGHSPPRLS